MIATKRADNSYAINGYKIFTNFKKCESRGVALYAQDIINARHLERSVHTKNDKILCGVVYRSPSLNNHESVITLMKMAASSDSYTRILIFDDFNYPEIDWETI